MISGTSNEIVGIWGSSANNVFAVGWNGVILHYDGNKWTQMESGTSNNLGSVWGDSENDVFAVGKNVILHYTPPTANPVLLTTPDTHTIPAATGTSTINISNSGTGTLTWTASETESWFSISPSSGTDTGTITVTYNANPGDTRTGTITVTAPGAANSPKTIVISQSPKQAHFTPVWTGNPFNSMRLWIVGADIDGVPLSAGDEIAVFDGSKCVGSAIVSQEISYENLITLIASQDDGSGNGYTKGNAITFKFWDASAGVEKTTVTPCFKNITDGNPVSPPVFEPNGDYGVILESGSGQQSIALSAGWNMMSSYVVPETADMLTLVQPLISSGCLIKVISETGGTVINVFGQWKNTIGTYNPDEGYKIKLSCNADFSVKGFSVQSQGNMFASSQSIPLSAGWNMIGYPYALPQNAMTAVQSLIDSGALIKVVDETGGTILKVFGIWKNTIGDFKPGKGYEIKVGADAALLLKEPAISGRSSDSAEPGVLTGSGTHFIPIWTGNPYNRMNLWLVGIDGYAAEPGDEIGIFDGTKCVGVGVVTGAVSQQNILMMITSQDDGTGNGFIEGNAVGFRFWDSGSQTELSATPAYMDITAGNPINAPVFMGNEDYAVRLTVSSGTVSLNDAILALRILSGITANPTGTNADADKNGRVELKDAVYILQVIARTRITD